MFKRHDVCMAWREGSELVASTVGAASMVGCSVACAAGSTGVLISVSVVAGSVATGVSVTVSAGGSVAGVSSLAQRWGVRIKSVKQSVKIVTQFLVVKRRRWLFIANNKLQSGLKHDTNLA